jgi:aryl carrier-like protein
VAEGLNRKYRNAFSFVCPPVAGTQLVTRGAKQLFEEAQVSPKVMLGWLKEALVLQRQGRIVDTYVPDLDWEATEQNFGLSRLGIPLLPLKNVSIASNDVIDSAAVLIPTILKHIDLSPEELDRDVPLTSYGLDSLSASLLSVGLQKDLGLKVSQFQLLANMTMDDLAQLLEQSKDKSSVSEELDSIQLANNKIAMSKMLQKYSIKEQASRNATLPKPERKVLLITGTTSGLGCNILHRALADTSVGKVYALNRNLRGTLVERQTEGLRNEGLPAEDVLSPKLVLIEAKYGAPRLGLSAETMEMVGSDWPKKQMFCLTSYQLQDVTNIIHNAWQTDFTLDIDAFESLIEATCDLIGIASRSTATSKPTFSLMSTISLLVSKITIPRLPSFPSPLTK